MNNNLVDSSIPRLEAVTDFIRTIHKINAILLSFFILAHLATHFSGIFGIETYNAVQTFFRTAYRIPPLEFGLITLVVSQMLLGLGLVVLSFKREKPSGFWAWAQILSGLYLILFLSQHLIALLIVRTDFELDTTFFWPASVMTSSPGIYYFAPYYFLAIVSILTHIGAALRYHLMSNGYEKAGRKTGIGFLLGGCLLAMIIVPALSGAYFPIELPQVWIDYVRAHIPDAVFF